MNTATIRIQTKTRDRLQRLVEARKQPISTIVEDAVSQYDDATFWADYQQKIAAIRADPDEWTALRDEVSVFEGTLLDGLHDEPKS